MTSFKTSKIHSIWIIFRWISLRWLNWRCYNTLIYYGCM